MGDKIVCSAPETEYITIPREEYDKLISDQTKLCAIITAIKADVLPATIRRIIRRSEGPYTVGESAGEFLRSLAQGFNDGYKADKDTEAAT